MTRRALVAMVDRLGSARVATMLLAFLGLWSVVASFVSQDAASSFRAPVFLACVFALTVSTAACAWRRTKVAAIRARMLREAMATQGQALATGGDLYLACDAASEGAEVLSITTETLGRLGIKAKCRGDMVKAVSPTWTVWGSPVFHWALVALAIVVGAGALWRTSGIMGLAVGQAKADQPGSYGSRALSSGPLRDWVSVHRTIRVDGFDLNYKTGGMDRGPTPLVTVLDKRGKVIKSQRVYPNHTLKTGSLTIYPTDYGLAAAIAIVDATGVETYRSAELIDFSGKAKGGTAPASPLMLDADSDNPLRVSISVPLDRTDGGFLGKVPDAPRARVIVASRDGETLLERVLATGEELVLPGGDTLRLLDVGYYARLQLVDDPSILALYVVLAVAVFGLGVAALARQGIVVAAVIKTEEGATLAVKLRLWRNVATSRAEIERELVKALSKGHGGDTT